MNGYILTDYKVEVLSFYVRNTKCGGNLCDRQQDDISKCACYQMPNRAGNVIISLEVKITLHDGSVFNSYIRSKWFLETFILKGTLPIGTRASNFEDFEVEDRFFSAVDDVTKYINNLCKFQIIGWVKRGEVMDQGVAQPSQGLPHNAARSMVTSGSLTHHITRLDPMKPSLVSQDYLSRIQFDTKKDFAI